MTKEILDIELNSKIMQQEENTLIAHYTSMEGLCGMLNSIAQTKGVHTLNLWASNIFSLNDPCEFKYGYSILRKWLPKIEDNLKVENDNRISRLWRLANIPRSKRPLYNKELEQALYNQEEVPYVLSFSHEVDNLPMLRMYGNDASGVCLVFSYGIIDQSCKLYDVCYDEKIRDYSPYDMLKAAYKCYLIEKKNTNIKEKIDLMLGYLASFTLIISPYIKLGNYEYEKEIRHSRLSKFSDGIKFRTSINGNLIPYKEIAVPLYSLKKIIIGPCANFEYSKYAIELLFKSKGISNIPEIVKSITGYRKV